MPLPYFATTWLRSEEQRPLKSGRGEKEKEAENWKSRRNQRSKQNPESLITDDFWLNCEPRTVILLGDTLCVVCVCVCVCVSVPYTETSPVVYFTDRDQSQNPVSFNPSLCFLTHIKRGVRHLYPEGVKHRCGHGRCIPAPRESCGEFEGLRSCKTCHFTAGRPWASHLPSLTLCFFLWKYLPQRDVVSVKWLTWVKLESTRWKDCVFPGVLQLLPKWNVA